MGARLATSPRKTSACYRNMYKIESSYLSLGRGGPPQRRRMTPCGESRMTLEATGPNTFLRKRAIRMGNSVERKNYV